ncbi:hypothetical protein ABZY36_03075 [Streptomyces sp. NPDC006627]|uniref:hypothetical protein n=1 Tax=Streptomyces sp. NPDC006627 TaxID=3154679 RepID=UPI0033A19B4F
MPRIRNEWARVISNMTKELPDHSSRASHYQPPLAVRRKVKVGLHPADVTSAAPVVGDTLNRSGVPVPPSTESLLMDFLDHMNALESGLAQRWRDSVTRPDVAMSE